MNLHNNNERDGYKTTAQVVASKKRTKVYRAIRTDLADQLERNGTAGEYYSNLVDDYMDMWITKCMLVEDIQERGLHVAYDNGGGQKGKKKNESVEMLIKMNAQMLRLLAELGIKPAQFVADDEDL